MSASEALINSVCCIQQNRLFIWTLSAFLDWLPWLYLPIHACILADHTSARSTKSSLLSTAASSAWSTLPSHDWPCRQQPILHKGLCTAPNFPSHQCQLYILHTHGMTWCLLSFSKPWGERRGVGAGRDEARYQPWVITTYWNMGVLHNIFSTFVYIWNFPI